MSDYYGISGLKEAQDYMADEFCQPSLGKLLNIKLKLSQSVGLYIL